MHNTCNVHTDYAGKPGYIHIQNLTILKAKDLQASSSNTPLKQRRSCRPDFSCLMILELKDFYQEKFRTFRKCLQSCERLCDCAYQFCVDLDAPLHAICKQAESFEMVAEQEIQFHIGTFAEDMAAETLYTSEELVGVGTIICPLYQDLSSAIDLQSFAKQFSTLPVRNKKLHIYPDRKKKSVFFPIFLPLPLSLPTSVIVNQEDAPQQYTARLKTIFAAVLQEVHAAVPTIATQATLEGNFITCISGNNFHHEYRSAATIGLHEAEADSIYQFLRHRTNVLGYNIVDLNYP